MSEWNEKIIQEFRAGGGRVGGMFVGLDRPSRRTRRRRHASSRSSPCIAGTRHAPRRSATSWSASMTGSVKNSARSWPASRTSPPGALPMRPTLRPARRAAERAVPFLLRRRPCPSLQRGRAWVPPPGAKLPRPRAGARTAPPRTTCWAGSGPIWRKRSPSSPQRAPPRTARALTTPSLTTWPPSAPPPSAPSPPTPPTPSRQRLHRRLHRGRRDRRDRRDRRRGRLDSRRRGASRAPAEARRRAGHALRP
jgi:hypothetical protein